MTKPKTLNCQRASSSQTCRTALQRSPRLWKGVPEYEPESKLLTGAYIRVYMVVTKEDTRSFQTIAHMIGDFDGRPLIWHIPGQHTEQGGSQLAGF